jgi:membrane protein YdbS with pleckstrin-like domain
MGTLSEDLDDLAVVLAIPFAILLAAGVVHLSVSGFLGRVSRWTVLYVAAAFVLVVLASLLTIQLFPALNRFTDFIHAVKMGYPAFWTVVLVSGAVALGRRHH